MNSRSFFVSLLLALSVPSFLLSPAAAQMEPMELKAKKTESPSHMPSSTPSSAPSKTPKKVKDESMVVKEGSTRRRRQQHSVMEISTNGSEKLRGI